MEHLALPQGQSWTHIEVPLYDCPGGPCIYSPPWESFPQRQGFNLQDKAFHNKNIHKYPAASKTALAAFVQSWLFFGILEEILGPEYKREAWLRTVPGESSRVDTSLLCERIDQWRARINIMTEDDWSHIQLRMDFLLSCMHSIHTDMSDPQTSEFLVQDMADAFNYSQLLPENLNISIDILHATLIYARNSVFPDKALSLPTYTKSRLMTNQMLADGWCLNEIGRLRQGCTVLGLYYCSRLGPLHALADHSSCAVSNCRSWQVDHGTYQTQHVQSDCECAFLEIDTDELAKILRNGGTPCVRMRENEEVVELHALRSEPFTAISHVWADGLGNLQSNSLPKCQLWRLQAQVDEAMTSKAGRSSSDLNQLFWVDTLCIPVGKAFEIERNQAIAAMATVYRLATNVLVLSRELSHVDVNRNPEEISARINRTAWFRRLWTLHEGVLSNKTVFQLRDGSVDLDILRTKISEAGEKDDFRTILSGVVFRETCTPFSNMELFKSKPFAERIRDIWSAVQQRSTSYKEDETICFANMLGLDLRPILAISRFDSKAQGRRMKAFILLQKIFPRDSVFEAIGNSMEEDGFRWAPRSFVFRTSVPEFQSSVLGFADNQGLHSPFSALDPQADWESFDRSIRRSAGHFGDFAEIYFMLPFEWDYFYKVAWHAKHADWDIAFELSEETVPAIIWQSDLSDAHAKNQKAGIPRMFEEELGMDGYVNLSDLDDDPFSATTVAVIVALSRRSKSLTGPLEEHRGRILVPVVIDKHMFGTNSRSAHVQVEGYNRILFREDSIQLFRRWPDSTRWCLG